MTPTQEQTIREEFQIHFPTGAFTDMQRAYMREIENFFINKINTTLEEQKKGMVEKLRELYEDEYPLDVITREPVETYGYEQVANDKLRDAIEIIQSHK